MNTNYRLIHMWSKCRRVGYSLEPPKTPFCIHFAHTHTQRTPECIAKTTTTTCKKQTKKTKTNANRSQNYKTKTNYIIKYLYTGILMGERVSQSEASVRLLCALRHLFRTTGYTVHGLRNSIWLEQQQRNAQIRNANDESKKKSQNAR